MFYCWWWVKNNKNKKLTLKIKLAISAKIFANKSSSVHTTVCFPEHFCLPQGRTCIAFRLQSEAQIHEYSRGAGQICGDVPLHENAPQSAKRWVQRDLCFLRVSNASVMIALGDDVSRPPTPDGYICTHNIHKINARCGRDRHDKKHHHSPPTSGRPCWINFLPGGAFIMLPFLWRKLTRRRKVISIDSTRYVWCKLRRLRLKNATLDAKKGRAAGLMECGNMTTHIEWFFIAFAWWFTQLNETW
jgi:hypothetical protein